MQNDELRRIQIDLEDAWSRYFDLYNLAPVGYCTMAENGLIQEVNLTVASMLATTRGVLYQQQLNHFVAPEDQDTYYRHNKKLFESGAPQVSELRMLRQDGKTFWARLDASLTQNAHGVPICLTVVSDISALKQVEAELRDAQVKLEQRVDERTSELKVANLALEKASRLKDEFLSGMSHELRTPLTGILGLAQVLQLQTYGELSEKQLRALHNLEASGWHLLDLINDVLDYSKIETGDLELSIAPCSLAEVCQASLQVIQHLAQKKQQQTSLVIDPATIIVPADMPRLKQVLVNLLSNAVKFTPTAGRLGIKVDGRQSETQVYITVWDTGIGIAMDDFQRLSQPFSQLDARLNRHTGAGLGLALVKRLVEMHGGQLMVESVPGTGTRFTFTLPTFGVARG
jgi:PAS domain S-box-containing protein